MFVDEEGTHGIEEPLLVLLREGLGAHKALSAKQHVLFAKLIVLVYEFEFFHEVVLTLRHLVAGYAQLLIFFKFDVLKGKQDDFEEVLENATVVNQSRVSDFTLNLHLLVVPDGWSVTGLLDYRSIDSQNEVPLVFILLDLEVQSKTALEQEGHTLPSIKVGCVAILGKQLPQLGVLLDLLELVYHGRLVLHES